MVGCSPPLFHSSLERVLAWLKEQRCHLASCLQRCSCFSVWSAFGIAWYSPLCKHHPYSLLIHSNPLALSLSLSTTECTGLVFPNVAILPRDSVVLDNHSAAVSSSQWKARQWPSYGAMVHFSKLSHILLIFSDGLPKIPHSGKLDNQDPWGDLAFHWSQFPDKSQWNNT